jgi:hypothetical protein
MNTERADILNRLASGQISADEASRLLRPPAELQGAPGKSVNFGGRWLHVRVTDLNSGRQKVNVNLPLAWVEVGMRIGAQYSPEIAGFDLGALVEEIKAGTHGKLVEVEDLEDNERVEVFVD